MLISKVLDIVLLTKKVFERKVLQKNRKIENEG
jgi:hypothetical protein